MPAETTSALIVLAAALLWDGALGEYPVALHPVVWIGKAISTGMRFAPQQGRWRQLLFGALLALGICALTVGITFLVLRLVAGFPIAEIVVGTFFLKASFALWELKRAADRVVQPLQRGDLPQARAALHSLCSRDPSCLDESALLAAVIESLAENLSDSFIAPLFYWTLFGIPGAMGYRAVNTLDAMIGYRGRFEFVGKAAARLDDVANWLPARLTAGLLLLAGCLTAGNIVAGWRILRRDGAKTPSPNGGRPMAVIAGLLGVELEKKGIYVLGDPQYPLTLRKVRQAWILIIIAAMVMGSMCGLATSVFNAVECGWRCPMIQTVEAVIDTEGQVHLLGEVHVPGPRRALVTVLEEPAAVPGEAALLAEAALAVDWNRPEEDAAWSHLQSAK